MSTPTTLRGPEESFEDWARRVETELVAAFEERRLTFALLNGDAGPHVLTPEAGENDEFFFRRAQEVSRDSGATQFVGATLGQFNTGPLGAVTCLLWYAVDAEENRAAHGLGQVFGAKVYSHQQVNPGNAPKAMRNVVKVTSS